MAATFDWIETNAGAVETSATNLNFGAGDFPNMVAADYPVLAGDNSYEKYLLVGFAGVFTSVSQLRFWMSSGTLEATETLLSSVIESGYTAPIFADPVDTTSTQALNAIPTTRPTNSNVGIGGSLAGTLVAPGRSDQMIFQLQVDAGAEAGPLSSKTFTMEWLEV